ncbi:MAG: N-glycosylase/DNA lyase, partial [Archaeoglobaceae archaeon]|nr:N-glycosylase/DNA lyase [Archaeoglobaceae archaeon]
KAEEVYWPEIRKILESSSIPNSPRDLFDILKPFYKKERLNSIKVQRLRKFLESSLANKIWKSSPEKISVDFLDVWKELAQVMEQKPQDKTICFAMKCLGISLLMSEEYKFDFSCIPIPVDSRVRKFTQFAGLCAKDTDQEIRAAWKDVLSMLREHYPSITMIHLDSLIWQIATLNSSQLREYFRNLNISEVFEKLSAFIRTKSELNATKIDRSQVSSLCSSRRNKVVCFIPCCGSKYASGEIIKPEHTLSNNDLPNTWQNLLEGRKGMQHCIDFATPKTSAINLYTGSPYEVFSPYKEEIIESIQTGKLRLIIISAGYGIVDALEPIQSYDAKMEGKIALHWRNMDLTDVIADLLMQERPARVYGFFAGKSYWSTPGAKYRYFFTEGVKTALINGLDTELCGCFYRIEGRGVKAILGSLGRTFIELLKTDFDDSYVKDIYKNGRWDGNVKIGFEWIERR